MTAHSKQGYMATHGAALVANGYAVLPIRPGTKRPEEEGWQHITVDPSNVESWLFENKGGWGVGIRGETTPAIDLDIVDPVMLGKVERWCAEHIGQTIQRTGRAPRKMLVYRTDTPFRKRQSAKFVSPDGETHQIELIGHNAQFVAFAVHPDTGKPYTWGEYSPLDTPADLLPVMTEQNGLDLIAFFEANVPDDWTKVQRATGDAGEHEGNPVKTASRADVESAVAVLPNGDLDYDSWIRVAHALRGAGAEYEEDARALFHEWSSKSEKYDVDQTDRAWDSIKEVKAIGAGTLFHLAEQHGWARPVASAEDEFGAVAGDMGEPPRATPPSTPLATVRASAFAPLDKPERRFVVADLIPDRNVTILNGDGATGKSLLAMQLGVAMAAGRRWVGLEVESGPVLYLAAEDDEDENHIRVKEICDGEGVDVVALDDLHIAVMAGVDCLLAVESEKSAAVLRKTKLFDKLRATVSALRPRLVVLDNLADIFGGNENVKSLARQFVGFLRGLAIEFDCAVLLLAHPSLSGMSSGSGSSGNVAWNNSVRSRLYLQRDKGDDGVEVDPNRRFLETKKANYAGVGTQIDMRWERGRFVALDMPELDDVEDLTPAEQKAERARRVFLDMVERFNTQRRNVAPTKGLNYAPSVFAQHSGARGLGQRYLEIAMNELLDEGAIEVEETGPPSKRRQNIVLCKSD